MYTSHSIDGWWLNVIRAVLISGCVQNISNTNNTLFDGLTICFTSWSINSSLLAWVIHLCLHLLLGIIFASLLCSTLLGHLYFTSSQHHFLGSHSWSIYFTLSQFIFTCGITICLHILPLDHCLVHSFHHNFLVITSFSHLWPVHHSLSASYFTCWSIICASFSHLFLAARSKKFSEILTISHNFRLRTRSKACENSGNFHDFTHRKVARSK